MGTVTNIQVGARSPLSGVTRALMLALVVLVAGGLTEPIPMAVLAYRGVCWGEYPRLGIYSTCAQNQSARYGHHVWRYVADRFVDLIVAVGLGVFISNILVIERLSREQARQVKAISDADDDDVPLTESERKLLDKANGKVLFFYLSGPMIFSVSKAITRQHSSVDQYQAMILDLTDVPMIDVTVGLALENAIRDAQEAHCEVYLLCPNEKRVPN